MEIRYLRVQADLLRRIRNGELPPGRKLPPENQLSIEYRVSRMTLRKALAILASEGHICQVRGLGTFVTSPDDPAAGLLRERSQYNNRRTKSVGMLISCVTGTLYPPIVRGAEDTLYENGYHLVLGNYDAIPAKEQRYMESFVKNGFSGVLVATSYNSHLNPYYGTMRKRRVPLVLIDAEVAGVEADLVCTDGHRGSREAVGLLVAAGRRRIAFVCGSLDSSSSRERLAGYREALEKAGIPARQRLVRAGRFTEEFGYEAVRDLLASERIDAVLSANEPLTPGVLRALHEKGLAVPDDVSVASFDEPELPPWVKAPIPLVIQPRYEIGKAAAEALLERIRERREGRTSSPKRFMIKPFLHTGETRGRTTSYLEVCHA